VVSVIVFRAVVVFLFVWLLSNNKISRYRLIRRIAALWMYSAQAQWYATYSTPCSFHIAVPPAHFGVFKRTQQNWTIYSVPPRPGILRPKLKRFPALHFFLVKDQSIKLSIETARKVQEHSRALVCESS